jgi:hypothetical protein
VQVKDKLKVHIINHNTIRETEDRTSVAAYAIALGVTLPSMWRRLATVLFVAFFCEVVFCTFRVGPSLDSCSSNASEDDGEVKMVQNVWEVDYSPSKR